MEKRGEFNSSKNICIKLIFKMMAETVNGSYKRESTLAISWVDQSNLVTQQDQLLYAERFNVCVNFYIYKFQYRVA